MLSTTSRRSGRSKTPGSRRFDGAALSCPRSFQQNRKESCSVQTASMLFAHTSKSFRMEKPNRRFNEMKMKHLSAVLFLASVVIAAGPDLSYLDTPLALPTGRADHPSLSLAELDKHADEFNKQIGGYPPRLSGADERQEIYRAWSETLKEARATRARDGD